METPYYQFSASELKKSYLEMCSLLKGVRVFYALKANADLGVLRVLASSGAGFEIASEGEFFAAIRAGVSADQIICGLPVKPEKMISQLYRHGCRYFVFDMLDEYEKLQRIAPDSKKILRLYINHIIPESLEFGMEYDMLKKIIRSNSLMGWNYDGFSFHISNNIDILNLNRVFEFVRKILRLLSLHADHPFILNIGGGYRLYASSDFYEQLQQNLEKLMSDYSMTVYAEPGNAIVNEAGILVTSVVAVRRRVTNQIDVYIDAGKPTGLKTDSKRIPTFIRVVGKEMVPSRTYRFVDITCMHRPHFEISLPYDIETGDRIELHGMGAYSVCLQSKFHLWESPKVYIVE